MTRITCTHHDVAQIYWDDLAWNSSAQHGLRVARGNTCCDEELSLWDRYVKETKAAWDAYDARVRAAQQAYHQAARAERMANP